MFSLHLCSVTRQVINVPVPLTVGPGWFGDEHVHTQVPATGGCGPHHCDIITGRRGDPDSQGAPAPCQT